MGLVFDQRSTERRTAFLRGLYDVVHGSATRLVYVEQVTRVLHFDEHDAEAAIEVLVAEELVRLRLQCILSITQAGIDEVRAALTTPEPPPPAKPAAPAPQPAVQSSVSHMLLGASVFPEEDTELPPVAPPVEIKNDQDDLELKLICEAIGLDPRELLGATLPEANGNHAVVEAGAPQPVLRTQPLPFNTEEIAETLASLKLRLLKLRLSKDDLAEAEAEIATATAQLLSPRPKQPIITAALNTLLSIVEQAGPATLTTDIQVSLISLRAFLQQPHV